jgi:hypothetical protein
MGGVDVQIHVYFTSALVGEKWSASRPDRVIPGERVASTLWMGGCVSLWSGLDDAEKRNSWPYRHSNSDPYVDHPVTSRYTDYVIPAPHLMYGKVTKSWTVHGVLEARLFWGCQKVVLFTPLSEFIWKASSCSGNQEPFSEGLLSLP